MLDVSERAVESASYTRIWGAARQAEKRVRAEWEGSMADRRCKENKGLFSRVEGTERETARARRAEE
jgi:hypothetical protein